MRRVILKWVYPLFMFYRRVSGKLIVYKNVSLTPPTSSFYNLKAVKNNGVVLDFNQLAGRYVLIVNTASDCGYTHQYHELEKLQQQYGATLTILIFPSNDFHQEQGSDEEIAAFCQIAYRLSLPVMKKTVVTHSPHQHEVYKWLTDKKLNGWNNQEPRWNFGKYLITPDGVLSHYFDSGVSPASETIRSAISPDKK